MWVCLGSSCLEHSVFPVPAYLFPSSGLAKIVMISPNITSSLSLLLSDSGNANVGMLGVAEVPYTILIFTICFFSSVLTG